MALAGRAGRVVPRKVLLSEIWEASADPHLLEVTVGRLRRRLGDLGAAVQVVPRRGYVLRS